MIARHTECHDPEAQVKMLPERSDAWPWQRSAYVALLDKQRVWEIASITGIVEEPAYRYGTWCEEGFIYMVYAVQLGALKLFPPPSLLIIIRLEYLVHRKNGITLPF